MHKDRLEYLFNLYLVKSASKEEKQELMRMLEDPANEEAVKDLIENSWKQWHSKHLLTEEHSQSLYDNLLRKTVSQHKPPHHKIRKIRRWQVAAAVILLIGAAGYFILQKRSSPDGKKVAVNHQQDIAAPASTHAILTLSNGTQLPLDSIQNGSLTLQGNTKMTKLANGQIVYQASGNHSKEVIYNTLTVPRGSKIIEVTLSDGSKVWLNASSSLHYPVVFNSRERKVEITGEAYFEIAQNASKPFTVTANKMQVLVLGTHFNVNAYTDEPIIKTTLLEGSIKITKGNATRILKPGQQAQINAEGKMRLVKITDPDQAVAWKNGFFSFHDADIQEVMRQISRWYDVEVQYDQNFIPRGHFTGTITRDTKLSQVLTILKASAVNFKIEGRKILLYNNKSDIKVRPQS